MDQAFNSLDAQREACGAYILSEASEGWTALPDIYDDGGLSGGSLERPALQRLLAAVATDSVDIIVVYKVDRLTRSLLDFAKLVEAFDKSGTSFVSVTQSFNTTTSMGRLTLNMLLSFAQFEREVTAERIRDKIAASMAKGMWMGGTPPLGYEPDGRSLKIVEAHADIIRDIYQRYLELGNVRLVTQALEHDGIISPPRVTLAGRTFGGVPLSRGQLYTILRCPTYVGEVHHGGNVYPGLHAAIIDRDIWDQVRASFAENRQGERRAARIASPSLFAGKVVDAKGQPLIASHASKGKTRYRYYISRDLQTGNATEGMRIARLFEDGLALAAVASLMVYASDVARLVHAGASAAAASAGRDHKMLRSIVHQVIVHNSCIEIICSTAAIATLLGAVQHDDAPDSVAVQSNVRLSRSGRAMRLLQDNGAQITPAPNPSLIKLLIKARRWWAQLSEGAVDIRTLADAEAMTASYVSRVVRLAFLAPAVVDAILAGTLRSDVDANALTESGAISPIWAEQVTAPAAN